MSGWLARLRLGFLLSCVRTAKPERLAGTGEWLAGKVALSGFPLSRIKIAKPERLAGTGQWLAGQVALGVPALWSQNCKASGTMSELLALQGLGTLGSPNAKGSCFWQAYQNSLSV